MSNNFVGKVLFCRRLAPAAPLFPERHQVPEEAVIAVGDGVIGLHAAWKIACAARPFLDNCPLYELEDGMYE